MGILIVKRKLIIFVGIIFIGLIIGISLSMKNEPHNIGITYQPEFESKEELYQDVFLILLQPYIQDKIIDYYSDLLGEPPMVDPYFIKVLSVERPHGDRTFEFIINLEVSPYIGPHNFVGRDYFTFHIGAGLLEIENFEHKKS